LGYPIILSYVNTYYWPYVIMVSIIQTNVFNKIKLLYYYLLKTFWENMKCYVRAKGSKDFIQFGYL